MGDPAGTMAAQGDSACAMGDAAKARGGGDLERMSLWILRSTPLGEGDPQDGGAPA